MNTRPILIQGAMIIEVNKIIESLENVREESIGCWSFFIGEINSYPVVVSKTEMGMTNAAAATVLAVERYNPIAIINQGTAGAHDRRLSKYDVIIGKDCINIGSFRSDFKDEGIGVNPSDWLPLKTSVVVNGRVRRVNKFVSDPDLIECAKKASLDYKKGKTLVGIIASADQWNKELDRILYFNEKYNTLGEDMETASCAQIAMTYSIPFVGIRVISNNELHKEVFAKDSSDFCQEFTLNTIKHYIETKK